MILTGNVALETMGFKTFGFGGGREDVWEPDHDVYWGAETTWLAGQALLRRPRAREPARRRADGPDLRQPGRPERQPGSDRRGPGHPRDLRAHGDERRGDRRADRRRPHLRQDPRRRPRVARRRRAGSAATSRRRASAGRAASARAWAATRSRSGLEVTWTTTPTKWSNDFFENLFGYEWELTKSPAGAHQWKPKNGAGAGTVPHAHDPSKRIAPTMLTTDLSLRFDPAYEKISRRFLEHPDQFADAFARAWFKLTHRDMGPRARYLGPEVPDGRADLAGPDPRGRSPADRRARTSPRSRPRSWRRACRSRSWCRPPGRRRPPSAAPTSAAARTARASGSRRRRTGRSTSRRSWRRC